MVQMDSQIKAMREMHQKMMSAASLEERRQLMADHMKTMKDSMAMMQGMMATRAEHKSAPIPAMMQKQMDMMQMHFVRVSYSISICRLATGCQSWPARCSGLVTLVILMT